MFLENICYTCGDVFEDYELPKGLQGIRQEASML